MEKVKFWQALLVVLTLFAFCAPKMMHKRMGGHGHSCFGSYDGKQCPYDQDAEKK